MTLLADMDAIHWLRFTGKKIKNDETLNSRRGLEALSGLDGSEVLLAVLVREASSNRHQPIHCTSMSTWLAIIYF